MILGAAAAMTRTTSKSPTYADRYMGERIREARLEAKMSQHELARSVSHAG
jgi:ribosome-binding protein aMBF1 (putative translation factor)